jgi:formate-dependent nitrite reductase membrane component NrfD
MRSVTELLEVVHGRHNELIDPGLHVWGWEIPVYLFLGGLAAGLLILPAALEWRREREGDDQLATAVRWAPLMALGMISIGMLALFLDLEFKLHVYRFYLSFEAASPMSWGAWILLLVYPVGWFLGIGLTNYRERARLGRGWTRTVVELTARVFRNHREVVLAGNVVAGVALGTYTGLLLGALAARPLWNSTILGPLFLVSGLSTAAAWLSLFRLPEALHLRLSRWEMGLLGTEAAFLAMYLLDLATGARASAAAARVLLGGPWTGPFWSVVFGLGLAVPFALKWVETTRHQRPALAAPVLVLLGGLGLRWILVAAGQTASYAMLP